ncbi:hypothetical protein [Herbaspirillum sp. alder98]|uniref:hypothetical protein n=1 Tax=Herbaspirillum sp. alder98 TaxID=2913096 RepID=UPI001CD8D214|nr:hypothetical protein [Herbaspirillum sp. alder98]MCA1325780.1 hypothetical protein [Herbaspirillum sp. alder98]
MPSSVRSDIFKSEDGAAGIALIKTATNGFEVVHYIMASLMVLAGLVFDITFERQKKLGLSL